MVFTRSKFMLDSWKSSCREADGQMEKPTDRKHTRAGLISPSDWSSQSGLTQCPYWQSSEWAGGWGRTCCVTEIVSLEQGWCGRRAMCFSRDRPQIHKDWQLSQRAAPNATWTWETNRDRGRHQNLLSAFNKYRRVYNTIFASLMVI